MDCTQPSFSIKGRSKLGSFSDDLHKARVTWLGHSTAYPLERWPIWSYKNRGYSCCCCCC